MEEGGILVSNPSVAAGVMGANERGRPKEFVKVDPYADSDDEESNVGKMPPSSDEEGEE